MNRIGWEITHKRSFKAIIVLKTWEKLEKHLINIRKSSFRTPPPPISSVYFLILHFWVNYPLNYIFINMDFFQIT